MCLSPGNDSWLVSSRFQANSCLLDESPACVPPLGPRPPPLSAFFFFFTFVQSILLRHLFKVLWSNVNFWRAGKQAGGCRCWTLPQTGWAAVCGMSLSSKVITYSGPKPFLSNFSSIPPLRSLLFSGLSSVTSPRSVPAFCHHEHSYSLIWLELAGLHRVAGRSLCVPSCLMLSQHWEMVAQWGSSPEHCRAARCL